MALLSSCSCPSPFCRPLCAESGRRGDRRTTTSRRRKEGRLGGRQAGGRAGRQHQQQQQHQEAETESEREREGEAGRYAGQTVEEWRGEKGRQGQRKERVVLFCCILLLIYLPAFSTLR